MRLWNATSSLKEFAFKSICWSKAKTSWNNWRTYWTTRKRRKISLKKTFNKNYFVTGCKVSSWTSRVTTFLTKRTTLILFTISSLSSTSWSAHWRYSDYLKTTWMVEDISLIGAKRKLKERTKRKPKLRRSTNSKLKWLKLELNKVLPAKTRNRDRLILIYSLSRRLWRNSLPVMPKLDPKSELCS